METYLFFVGEFEIESCLRFAAEDFTFLYPSYVLTIFSAGVLGGNTSALMPPATFGLALFSCSRFFDCTLSCVCFLSLSIVDTSSVLVRGFKEDCWAAASLYLFFSICFIIFCMLFFIFACIFSCICFVSLAFIFCSSRSSSFIFYCSLMISCAANEFKDALPLLDLRFK